MQGQSQDSIRLIEKLVEKFVKQERTDILAVVPAHQDIATIDVLEVSFVIQILYYLRIAMCLFLR